MFDVTGVAANDVLNIRAAPDASAEIIGTLSPNARDIEVVLLFGARNAEELLYGDEFRAFADAHPKNFRLMPCFSHDATNV